jgi:nucleotide-binding universal stress UspA family protein
MEDNMYRSIIVPLDGSPFAEHALPFATSIARRAGAAVQIIQAHMPVALYSGSELGAALTLDGTMRENETAYLDSVLKRLEETVPVQVSRTLVDGPAAGAIHDQALAAGADLVVMATHGLGGLSRFWLGSVADTLVRRLPMPVLLIRPLEGAVDLARDHVLKHILVPLDGSELAEQTLGPAVTLGTIMQADYTLFRVVNPIQSAGVDAAGHSISGFAVEGRERLLQEATTYLDRIAAHLRERSLRVVTRVIVDCQVAETILSQTGSSRTDVIALATHGRGGVARLLLGSVADKVIRGALTPVLVHRPLGKADEQ